MEKYKIPKSLNTNMQKKFGMSVEEFLKKKKFKLLHDLTCEVKLHARAPQGGIDKEVLLKKGISIEKIAFHGVPQPMPYNSSMQFHCVGISFPNEEPSISDPDSMNVFVVGLDELIIALKK